jgi:hypothetical protein
VFVGVAEVLLIQPSAFKVAVSLVAPERAVHRLVPPHVTHSPPPNPQSRLPVYNNQNLVTKTVLANACAKHDLRRSHILIIIRSQIQIGVADLKRLKTRPKLGRVHPL